MPEAIAIEHDPFEGDGSPAQPYELSVDHDPWKTLSASERADVDRAFGLSAPFGPTQGFDPYNVYDSSGDAPALNSYAYPPNQPIGDGGLLEAVPIEHNPFGGNGPPVRPYAVAVDHDPWKTLSGPDLASVQPAFQSESNLQGRTSVDDAPANARLAQLDAGAPSGSYRYVSLARGNPNAALDYPVASRGAKDSTSSSSDLTGETTGRWRQLASTDPPPGMGHNQPPEDEKLRPEDEKQPHEDAPGSILFPWGLPAAYFVAVLAHSLQQYAYYSNQNGTNRYESILDAKHLDAAARELRGEVVSRRPDGKPYDHVDEVRNAQKGLMSRIQSINNALSSPTTDPIQRYFLQRELSQASRLLDHSEEFVPRAK
jgi:hypothetical protein